MPKQIELNKLQRDMLKHKISNNVSLWPKLQMFECWIPWWTLQKVSEKKAADCTLKKYDWSEKIVKKIKLLA